MSSVLVGKQIVLGVSGGIAAYKSVELLRLLVKAEARVRVIMTRNATRFVGPLTFEALSDVHVVDDLFEEGHDTAIGHIQWATEAEAVVLAPATANLVSKLANGLADDALSTFLLAVTAPVMVCPAMNTHMYEHPATQRNLEMLKADGHVVLTPGSGQLACGTTGPGRMPEPENILDRLEALLAPKDLKGKTVLISAGPTREYWDPVRFISNPASGKMGYAMARAAEHRGARVILVTGPTTLPAPANMQVLAVDSAQEMADAILDYYGVADVVIKAAAVSDYRPQMMADHKVKKSDGPQTVILERTRDILKTLGNRKSRQFLVGFAAETEDLLENAHKKLQTKNLDMIVANLVGREDSGFGSDTNRITLLYKNGQNETPPLKSKQRLAHVIFDRIVTRLPKTADD